MCMYEYMFIYIYTDLCVCVYRRCNIVACREVGELTHARSPVRGTTRRRPAAGVVLFSEHTIAKRASARP